MVLEAYANRSLASCELEWHEALEYVQGYTGPVTQEHLDEFLAAIGLTGRAS